MLRAVIYARISLDRSGEELGVQRQIEACTARAEALGGDVVDLYVDNDRSAFSGKARPQFERLLSDAKESRFDIVVTWASDRLYRLVSDLTRITAELTPNARVVTVMGGEVDLSSAEGIMRAQIMGSVAEFESRRKGERQSAAIAQQLAQGRWHGLPPRGYLRQGNTLVIDPVWGPRVKKAFETVLAGGSMTGAAREMGMRATSLRRVFKSPALCGMNSVGILGGWEALVSEPDWRRLQALLADRNRPDRMHPRSKGSTLLAGIMTCGHGGRVVKNVEYYRASCEQCTTAVRRDFADDQVVRWVLDRLTQPDVTAAFAVPARDADWARIEELRHRKATILSWASQGLIQLGDARDQLAALTAEIDVLSAQARPQVLLPNNDESVDAVWARLSLEQKRNVIRLLADVSLEPVQRYGRGPRRIVIAAR